MNLNVLNQVDIEEYLGIPWQWIDEINKACDAFFRKRGIPVYSIRDSIHAETLTRVRSSNLKTE
jgi:hypothetical protein